MADWGGEAIELSVLTLHDVMGSLFCLKVNEHGRSLDVSF
jgi:hypothetical protein